jgi:glycine dehydrogenase subunit 1
MRYTPHTSADKEQMLRAIGLTSIDELFRHIPRNLRDTANIDLAPGLSEFAVKKKMGVLAARNANASDWSFFLGGGIYSQRH